jgi:glycosyltransferase involved in cell wall biosynthesis
MARLERSQASGVIALGPDMAARLSASGAKHVAEIPVWSSFEATAEAQAAARDLRRARGWAEGEVILLYSGNMGRAHDAGGFAELAERLRGASPRCRFIFAGLGPRRTEWERIGGGRFEFMPPVPEHACAAHLLAADVHLVSQRAEWTGLVVPSKFQAACSLGRPVVFSGPPESAVGTWLAGSDAGWVLPEGDSVAQAIAAAGLPDARVRAEKAANAFRLFEQRFTKAGNCASVVHRIEQALQDRI